MMASSRVLLVLLDLLVLLVLVSLASASHNMGGSASVRYKGRNPDGTFRVQIRNRDTYTHCQYNHHWACYRGNCGTSVTDQRGTIDSGRYGPRRTRNWCETESVTTRTVPTDKPFQLKSSSCCWIGTRNSVSSWRLRTLVDLGSRSDTGEPNRSPDVATLPFLRVPQNCPRSYRMMAFDGDGDQVRCRYGTVQNLECSNCNQPSGFILDQASCTLQYHNSYSHVYVHAFQLVVEDFPKKHIQLAYSDGSRSYRGPLSSRRKRAYVNPYYVPTPWHTTAAPTTTPWWWRHTTAPTTAAPTTTPWQWWWHTTTASSTTAAPTTSPWQWWRHTTAPTTAAPTTTPWWWWTTTTTAPTTAAPTTTSWRWWTTTTTAPTTAAPTTTSWRWWLHTTAPTTAAPTTTPWRWWLHTTAPTTAAATTAARTTAAATTAARTTAAATTAWPTTAAPTTAWPTTAAPTTAWPTTAAPTTASWTTPGHTTPPPTTVPWWWHTTTPPTTTPPLTTVPWWWHTTTSRPTAAPTHLLTHTTPLSKLPLQFSFLVDNAAPSCQEGLYLPKLVAPTPQHGAHIEAEVNKQLEIRVRATAAYATISDLVMSGPLNMTKHRTTTDEFVIRWQPTSEQFGDVFPICFAIEAVSSSSSSYSYGYSYSSPQSGIYQSEMRCVLVGVQHNQTNVHVVCSASSMRVEMEKSGFSGLSEDHLQLSDPTNTQCRLQSNATHVYADIPLNACGTLIEEDDDSLLFKNEITTSDDSRHLITRMNLLEVRFFCQYSKRGNVTLGFTAHRSNVTVWERGFGTFTYAFEFFPDTSYRSMIDPRAYPLEYDLGSRVYMQIQATSTINNTELFVESCRAAPYDNPNYRPTYPIIDNGCPVDLTVQIHSPPHQNYFQFSMEAFKFIGLHDQVYISCSVLICQAGNPNTRCTRGCLNATSASSRRRRDAVAQTNLHYVSQGPLRLRRATDTAAGGAGTQLNLNVVFLCGCVLAVVGMISAVVVYKTRASSVRYRPLPTYET